MQSTTPTPHRNHFDSDSYDILVDNCCSKSITTCLDDFITPPKPSNLLIKGFNGATATTRVGTVQCHLQNDKGRVHKLTLPHTYYSNHAEHRLLSPQHWAQVINQGKGTRCITYHDSIVLIWDNDKYRKTVPLSPINVRGHVHPTKGMKSYLLHCQQATYPVLSFPTTIHQKLPMVTDSEDEPDSDMDDTASPAPILQDQPTESTKTSSSSPAQEEPHTQKEIQDHVRPKPIRTRPLSKERQDMARHNPTIMYEQQEYMRWHYKLNHASQKVITKLANKACSHRTSPESSRLWTNNAERGRYVMTVVVP